MSNLSNILKQTVSKAVQSSTKSVTKGIVKQLTSKDSNGVTDLGEIVVTGVRRQPTAEGFSLANFKTEMTNESIIQSSRHLMFMTLPRGLLDIYDPNDVRSIILRCDATSLPGITFAESEEIRRYGIGPGDKQPYMPIFGPIAASYIVDGAGVIHSFFYDWLSFIIGFDSSNGMLSSNGFQQNPYEVSYKEDYASQVKIYVHNELNNKIMEVTLNNAYPIAMDAVPLAWSATDEFMRLNVTWDYTDWSAKYFDPVSNGLTKDINSLKSIVNVIGNISNLNGFLGQSSAVSSLIGKIGNTSQRITDIKNLVSGSSQMILNSVKSRFGF